MKQRTAALKQLLLSASLVTLGACDAQMASGPPDAQANVSRGYGGLGQSALLVGNLNFEPTDAILRYDGRGHLVDVMIPDGTAGLSGSCCLTFGPDENLYVSSPFTGSVLRFHGFTGEFIDEFIPAGSGGLVIPLVLLFHEGRLYVGDPGTNAIRRYDATTGAFIDVFVPPGSQGMALFDPQHFEFGPDGRFYVAAEYTNRLLRYDGTTGAFIDEFIPAGPDNFDPSGLTFGADGLLYVGGPQLNQVRRYDIGTGALIDIFVQPGSGGLTTPVGIVFGPDGNLYVASAGTGEVLRYDGGTGEFIEVFVSAGSGGITAPRMLKFKSNVTLCHKGVKRSGAKTITMGYLTASGHIRHGDELGACD
jgi:outer membrane protein assembly factor BamB